jgi:thioredoxin 1
MSVKEITGKDAFAQELEDADKLIIVDFWAEWCGPCRMLGPVLHDLAEKYPDQVQLLKINVDSPDNQPLAMEYGVRSIPQVTFFK